VKFAVEPARYPQNLTLRVRHGIEPGRIRPPAPRVAAPPPPVGPPGAASMAVRLDPTDTYGSMMGQRPVDPAPVRLPSGEAVSVEQLQRFLPRLVTITTARPARARRGSARCERGCRTARRASCPVITTAAA
jgi:hypothetical protein